MAGIVSIGIGAGLISALLFAVVLSGSPLGMLLCYVAPVPILIVALGWTHLAGLLAAAIGGAALSAMLGSRAGLAFALGSGFPAWILAYLALLHRPGAGPDGTRWLSPGRLLAALGAISGFVALASTVALGRGDAGRFRDSLGQVVEAILRVQFSVPAGTALPRIAGMAGADFVAVLVGLAPAIAAGIFVLAFTVNLWAAAKTVLISGRLIRPWPDLSTARMPLSVLGLGAVALLFATLPGFPGIAGTTLAGGLAMAFALQALALFHAVTAGRPGRRALLAAVYFGAIVFGATALPALALIGIADTILPIRERFARRGRPDPS